MKTEKFENIQGLEARNLANMIFVLTRREREFF